MNRFLKLQLFALALALLLLVVAVAWTARTGWREVSELREGLVIAEQFDAAVVKMNGRAALTESQVPLRWTRAHASPPAGRTDAAAT